MIWGTTAVSTTVWLFLHRTSVGARRATSSIRMARPAVVRFCIDKNLQSTVFTWHVWAIITVILKLSLEIDHCADGTHGCEQEFMNTEVGCVCKCRQGFILRPDGKTCESKSVCFLPISLLERKYYFNILYSLCTGWDLSASAESQCTSVVDLQNKKIKKKKVIITIQLKSK